MAQQGFLIERINITKVKQLMLDLSYVNMPNLRLDEFDDANYFLLENKKLLIAHLKDEFGVLCETVDELLRFRNSIKEDKRLEALKKLDNVDAFFLENTKYRDFLSKEFILKKEQLDFSFNSLKILDSKLYVVKDFDDFMTDYYIPIINYLGQVLIKEKNGKWIKTFNNEYNLYEPEIELPSKKVMSLSFDLYDEANENFNNFTLLGTAIMRLDSL